MNIEYEKKLDICCKRMAEDFGINEKQARKIIKGLDLFDIVFEYYEDDINEYFEELDNRLEEEINNNYDLYKGNINGGI